MSSPERKRSCHFSRFIGNVINLVPKWASNWCAWTLGDEKASQHEVKKHDKKTSKKNIKICSKMVHKEGPKKVIFL